MKAKALLYTANGMDFLKIVSNKRNKPYTLKFLEKLCGFKLKENAPKVLFDWGYIRVCKNSVGSYRKD